MLPFHYVYPCLFYFTHFLPTVFSLVYCYDFPDFSLLSSVIVLLFPVCGSVSLAGWVQSPGHPRGYDPHSNLTWTKCAPTGHKITLTLIHLDLEESFECEDDALKVCEQNDNCIFVQL